MSNAGREADEVVAGEQGPEGRVDVLFENDREARVGAEGHEGQRNTAELAPGQSGLLIYIFFETHALHLQVFAITWIVLGKLYNRDVDLFR